MMPSRSAQFGVHRQVVGDEQQRGANLLLHLADQRQHALLHHHVERRGRLVGDDEFRPADRRQRDGDALAHAAGQFVRIRIEYVARQMQPPQVRPHAIEESPARRVDVAGGEVDEGMPHPPHRVQRRSSSPA